MTYTTLPMRPKKTGSKKTALLLLLLLLFSAAGLGALWRAWDARSASAPHIFAPQSEKSRVQTAPPAVAPEAPQPEAPRSLMPFYGGEPKPFSPPPLKPVPQESEPTMRVHRGQDAWTGAYVRIVDGKVSERSYVIVTVDGDRKRVKTYPASMGKFWGARLGDASKPHHIVAEDGSGNVSTGRYDGRGCIDWTDKYAQPMIKCQHIKAVPAGADVVGEFFFDP